MKSNQILIGIIIVLIGIFSVVRQSVAFDFGTIVALVMGLAFLLLYRQKKAVWALFVGAYLACFGLSASLASVGLDFADGSKMLAYMFFIIPGAVFLVLYFDKHKYGLLTPGCILLWLGFGFVLSGLLGLGISDAIGVTVICLGLSFCMVYLIGRSYMARGIFHIGVIVVAVGALLSGGFTEHIHKIISGTLVLLGIFVVVKGILSRPRR